MQRRLVKIGIDVGGTFTHAAAVDAERLRLLGAVKVPTTHTATEGVAHGVSESLTTLLRTTGISPDEIVLVAHCTTQATNALLEGDAAPVGIIGLGRGFEGLQARRHTRLDRIELAPGMYLQTYHTYFDTAEELTDAMLADAIDQHVRQGARVFVVSEAFSIDDASLEQRVAAYVRQRGYPATAASDVSKIYGLKVRTRTAVLNACMLPAMLETARRTEQAVRSAGLTAPLMVMRGDGGLMDMREMERRPILTVFSGAAAGVSAALSHLHVTDGMFIDVGGTSTDISAIKNGRPMIHSTEIGGHRLHVRALDVRTVGIAAGSIPRWRGRKIVDVGPRSAHSTGMRYAVHAAPEEYAASSVQSVQIGGDDASDYVAFSSNGADSAAFTVTPSDAARVLGLMKPETEAHDETVKRLVGWLPRAFQEPAERIARQILDIVAGKITFVMKRMMAEYRFDPGSITIVAAGGGAEALVPYAAKIMNMDYWIANDAESVSAVGAALAAIRDTVERTIVQPSEHDFLKVRKEAVDSVIAMGAESETISVLWQYDAEDNRLIAMASGELRLSGGAVPAQEFKDGELQRIAAESCGCQPEEIACIAAADGFRLFQSMKMQKRFFGVMRSQSTSLRLADLRGNIHLRLTGYEFRQCTGAALIPAVTGMIDDFAIVGDTGELIPGLFVAVGAKLIDLTGLVSREQVLSVLHIEAGNVPVDAPAIVIGTRRA